MLLFVLMVTQIDRYILIGFIDFIKPAQFICSSGTGVSKKKGEFDIDQKRNKKKYIQIKKTTKYYRKVYVTVVKYTARHVTEIMLYVYKVQWDR